MSTDSNYEKPGIEKLDQNDIQQKFADFAKLDPEQTYRLILENMPIHCVDTAIYNHSNEVLLVKRRSEPARNRW